MPRPIIPDCYDPIEQERSRDLAYNARLMRRPRCQCCGCPVISETYLDLEPFGLKGVACERCIEGNTHDICNLENA